MPIRRLCKAAARDGLLAACIPPPWPTKYAGSHIIGGVKPEEFDSFHELIFMDEVIRCGGGFYGGLSIGLPPVLFFGSDALKEKACCASFFLLSVDDSQVVRPCLAGDKIICLAITEPNAGSDVAQIQCEAKKSPCGKYVITQFRILLTY